MKPQWGNSDLETNIYAKTELVELLASEDPEMRTEAMERLGIAGEAELLPFLSDCLAGSNDRLRSAASRVLTDLGDDSALLRFIDDLASSDRSVRYNAHQAILSFDDPRSLIQHMQRYLRNDGLEKSGERRDAIGALDELGDERTVPFLIGALYDPERNV